jgi:hypothetical protein
VIERLSSGLTDLHQVTETDGGGRTMIVAVLVPLGAHLGGAVVVLWSDATGRLQARQRRR